MSDWLSDAVFYEIYPQSFADSDGDGIGDLPGALSRLDHLAALGVNAVWFNPCFASPFRDAGYDVSDYLRIAPRYGTNDDMVAFVDAARERGIRVVLALVAGPTSTDHEWFRRSAAGTDDDRYIWSDRPGADLVPSPGPRPGYSLATGAGGRTGDRPGRPGEALGAGRVPRRPQSLTGGGVHDER